MAKNSDGSNQIMQAPSARLCFVDGCMCAAWFVIRDAGAEADPMRKGPVPESHICDSHYQMLFNSELAQELRKREAHTNGN